MKCIYIAVTLLVFNLRSESQISPQLELKDSIGLPILAHIRVDSLAITIREHNGIINGLVTIDEAIVDSIQIPIPVKSLHYSTDRPKGFFNKNDTIYELDLASFNVLPKCKLPSNSSFHGILNDKFLLIKTNGDVGELPKKNHDGGMLYPEELVREMFLLDQNCSVLTSFHVDSFPIDKQWDIGELFYSPKSKIILASTSLFESGGRGDERFFLLELYKRSHNEIEELGGIRISDNNVFFGNILFERNGNLLLFIGITDNAGIVDEKLLLFDKDFKLLGEGLPFKTRFSGIKYEAGEFTKAFLVSELDYKAYPWKRSYISVIIEYDLSTDINEAFFQIFNNNKLNELKTSQLNLGQLTICKNLIFAKHNYSFDSEYYQAFFNLFPWYNSDKKRQTRTKEVNHLLTKADKHNLNIINKALKELTKK